MSSWDVCRDDVGQKLVHFLQSRLGGGWSLRAVKRLLDQSGCLVDGEIETFASRQLREGERVLLARSDLQPAPRRGWWQERVLYEDDHLFVIDKLPGVVSDDIELLSELADRKGALLVHRLDRDTSGVWLFARSAAAERGLKELFRVRKLEKHYVAIVDGIPDDLRGAVTAPITRYVRRNGQNGWRLGHAGEGRSAETHWVLEHVADGYSWLSCFPKSGRTHQIRLHLRAIGHPILGDYRYARKFVSGCYPVRQMLHAKAVSFVHPITGKSLSVEARLPDDMVALRTDG